MALILGGGLLAAALFVLAIDRALPPPLEVQLSRVVTDSDGLPLRTFPVEDGRWRLAADLDRVDPRFIEALLLIEDERFYAHGGVDLLAVLRASRDNILRGRIVSGASTITMQTARLLEPRPRTLPSKAIEAFRAWQIERRLTKREVLELYLTLTPYGGNLEGIRTASLAYLGRDPKALTDAEIALLLAIPQAPEARRPDLRPEAARGGRKAVLSQLEAKEFLPAQRMDEANVAAVPEDRKAFPSDAWHFAGSLKQDGDKRAILRTTIDRPAQMALQRLLAITADSEGPDVQAAGLIVRLEDNAVIASVGSVGRGRPGGWMDLTNRKRSPGSTLKPFVYGLAFQEGIAAPGTRIADLPTRFGGYEPQNFGRTFNGELTAAEALQHSLNVPAVLLLDRVGPARFLGSLRSSGVPVALPGTENSAHSLAVALGGLGTTAQDLALLYAALGHDGEVRPLIRTQEEALVAGQKEPFRLLSAEAAEDIRSILEASPTVDGRLPAKLGKGGTRIAFKTGTSYGFRDAWAAGVSGDHAVVVWIGRPDGGARPGATGRETALPVLFDVFDAISVQREGVGEDRPAEPKPVALRRIKRQTAPEIVFPQDGSTLWSKADGRPFVLSARGNGSLSWYVDGKPIQRDRHGNVLWHPDGEGFYRFTVADAEGRTIGAKVRLVDSGA
nr:penicillin-binding protein 1C [Parvularcula mediterranea]